MHERKKRNIPNNTNAASIESGIQRKTSAETLQKLVLPNEIIQQAMDDPESLSNDDIMQLQRTIGNQAVMQLFRKSEALNFENTQIQKKETETQESEDEEQPILMKRAGENSGSFSKDVIQCLAFNNAPIDINTLTIAECRAHLAREARIAHNAGQPADAGYAYAVGDRALIQARLQVLEAAALEVRRLAVVANLSNQFAALATAGAYTVNPPWFGLNPATADGNEVFNGVALQVNAVVARWQAFLGAPPYNNLRPSTGNADVNRLVSGDGSKSIRYSNHERDSSANLHHFHEETWVYNAACNALRVDNQVRRVPVH